MSPPIAGVEWNELFKVQPKPFSDLRSRPEDAHCTLLILCGIPKEGSASKKVPGYESWRTQDGNATLPSLTSAAGTLMAKNPNTR